MSNSALKKAVATAIGIVGFTTLSSSLLAASFDCAKATTSIEKMVCSDENASRTDLELSASYINALNISENKNELKQQQRQWLKTVRNSCEDVECLIKVNQSRTSELIMYASDLRDKTDDRLDQKKGNLRTDNQKFPLQFKLVEGDSYPLCQPYVDMLNKTKYMEYPSCERILLPEFEQFKSIEWTEITDKKEIEKIMEELVRLDVVRDNEIDSPHHQRVWKKAKERIYSGSSRYYFSKFDFEKDDEYEILYKETIKYPGRQKNSLCKYENIYDVEDKKLTIEKVVKHSIDPYIMLKGLHAHLFIFDGKVINSIWQPYGNIYSIELWTSNRHPALCKIKVE